MLKLIEALKRVDRSKSNEAYVSVEVLCNAVDIETDFMWEMDRHEEFERRIKGYWLIHWLCSDTWVGLRALYFDGELAGVIEQTARKNDEIINFLSVDVTQKIRDFLLSAKSAQAVNLLNPDEEILETYCVTYGSQILAKQGFYKGTPVSFVQDCENWHKIMVRDTAGKLYKIDVEDYDIPLHLTPNND